MGRKWLNGKSREVAIPAIWKQFVSWPPFLLHYPIGDYSNTRSSSGLPQIQHQSVLPGPSTVDPCRASRSWVHLHPSAKRVFAALWRSVKRTPRSRYFIKKVFFVSNQLWVSEVGLHGNNELIENERGGGKEERETTYFSQMLHLTNIDRSFKYAGGMFLSLLRLCWWCF